MYANRESFYKKVRGEYEKAEAAGGPAVPLITESSIRLEQFISASVTNYNFPVLSGVVAQGSTAVLATELRLQQNDIFHIRDIGIFLALTVASTDTNFVLRSYAAEVEWGAASALDTNNIWNGVMNINVNQKDVLTNYPIIEHRMVPTTQRISVAANTVRDEIHMKNIYIPLVPSVTLNGKLTNTITIQLPGAVTNAIAASNSRIVLNFLGLRAQNAAISK